jgi:ABC-type glutathione transport system ATPase component
MSIQKMLQDITNRYNECWASYNSYVKLKQQTEQDIENYVTKKEHFQAAAFIFQEIAREIQETLVFHVTEISNLALSTVFEDSYELSIEFEIARNRSEAQIRLKQGKEGVPINPMDSTGGGVVDVLSFGLRVSLWTLQTNPSAPVLIFDEPFKFLSNDHKPLMSQVIKQVAEKLGLQIIAVTHDTEFIDAADKVIKVHKHKGKSFVS